MHYASISHGQAMLIPSRQWKRVLKMLFMCYLDLMPLGNALFSAECECWINR